MTIQFVLILCASLRTYYPVTALRRGQQLSDTNFIFFSATFFFRRKIAAILSSCHSANI